MLYSKRSLIVLVASSLWMEAYSFTNNVGLAKTRFVQPSRFATVEDKPSAATLAETNEQDIASVSTETPLPEGVAAPFADDILPDELLKEVELEAQKAVDQILEEECEIDFETGGPKDEICVDEEKKEGMRLGLRKIVSKTLQLVRGSSDSSELDLEDEEEMAEGEIQEQGWDKRANSGSIARNAEIWKVALSCVFKALKPRKMRAKGASDEEIEEAQLEAAVFIRDNLLKLGPSFVKVRTSSIDSSSATIQNHSPTTKCSQSWGKCYQLVQTCCRPRIPRRLRLSRTTFLVLEENERKRSYRRS